MNPLAVIQEHRDELRKLGGQRVGVFGSFANGTARSDSDVDVYIEFEDAKRTYDNFFAVYELLEGAFGRPVDLVPINL
jgi:hypothetical protein